MKKVLLLSTVLFCLSAEITKAQTFEKIYRDMVGANPGAPIGGTIPTFHNTVSQVKHTLDGGFLIIGNQTDPSTSESNMMIIKTSEDGSPLWKKYFGGYGDDFNRAVIETADGSFVITGGTNTVFAGGMDVVLLKIDSTGNELWTKTYGGEGDEEGTSLKQTSDGGYIIAGKTNSSGAGNEDAYLLKTDAAGNLLWSRTFGGALVDMANSVMITADGGYFITGQTQSFGAGNWDAYLIKTNAAGDLQWSKTAGGTGADIARSAVQSAEGELIVAGSTENLGDTDAYLFKISAAGDAMWAKTIGGINADKANSLEITSDGGYILSGETESFGAGNKDVYLVKTSSGGNADWTKTYGADRDDNAAYAEQLADGTYIIAGISQASLDGAEGVLLIKTDENGNTACYQNNTTTIIATVTLTVADVQTGITTAPLAVSGSFTSLLEIYNSMGIESPCGTDPEGTPMSGGDGLTPADDLAAAQIITTARAAIQDKEGIPVGVYPNPSAGQFYFSGLTAGANIRIYTASGTVVLEQNVSDAVEKVDLTGQAKGFYFYRVTGTDGKVQQSKILIQ